MLKLNMKYSEIDLTITKEFLSIETDFTRDDGLLMIYINGARALIESYTGKDSEYLDNYKTSTIVLLKTIGDFHQNRLGSIGGIRETQLDPMYKLLLDQITDLKAGELV